jgi:hypothetical protein
MKPVFKHVIAKLIVLTFVGSAQAVTTLTVAFDHFLDADGNVGFAGINQQTDPTNGTTTTFLAYSFCLQTTAPTCLEGYGIIPNDAFRGQLTQDFSRADVLKLQADTTIAGFNNDLCSGPNQFGGCDQGKSPATGGLINLVFVKKRGDGEIQTFKDLKKVKNRITLDSVTRTAIFSGRSEGTVIGVNANSSNVDLEFQTLTGEGTAADHDQSHLVVGKALFEKSPQTVRRLERLTGKTVSR